MKTTTVITTRNEADTIGSLVALCKMVTDEVVVIDEGSRDGTRGIAKDWGADLVRGHSGGIGPCQRYGYHLAIGRGASRIVQIDAGGSHDAAQIPAMLDSSAEVVVGSRYLASSIHDNSLYRRAGSWVYGALWRHKVGVGHTDWTSGFRVYTAEAAKTLLAHEGYVATMHGWQAEALALLYSERFRVGEYPIHYRGGESSLSPAVVREAMRAWWAWKA